MLELHNSGEILKISKYQNKKLSLKIHKILPLEKI